MVRTTVKVDGMMCGMCESHVNDAVRKAFQVNKVTSSHTKGETVIITDTPVDEAKLKTAINATGYEVKGVTSEPYEKKRDFFPFFISRIKAGRYAVSYRFCVSFLSIFQDSNLDKTRRMTLRTWGKMAELGCGNDRDMVNLVHVTTTIWTK